jgi:acetyl esterase/lipase
MPFGILAAHASSASSALACISIVLFGFQMWISNVQTLPSDFFSNAAVGSVAGMGGTAAGISSLICNLCTAWLVAHFGYSAVLTIAGVLAPIGGEMNRWIEIVAGVTLIASLTFSAAAQQPAQPPPVNPEFIALPNTTARALPIEHKNITYLRASGQDLQLDVYQQPGTKPSPVIVYFHGGAWWKNARPQSAASFQSLLSLGFSLVMVDYRLTGVAPAPAAIQDARCSLSWVSKNAKTYNFDLNEVIVFGTSSGGHQALMSGMLPASSPVDLPECKDQPRAAALLDFYGISDVRRRHDPQELRGPLDRQRQRD